jgi:sulfate adenylyltransferase subunit 2
MKLSDLESESIEILREAIVSARNPVMMYSMGKDSSVMLHLARKAFYPAVPPFPLLHIDTTWKFREMIAQRNRIAAEPGMKVITHINQEGISAGVTPFSHGSSYYTDVMKTQALRQALDQHQFDVIIGGARRDEEKARAKERVFSFRRGGHRWDPKAQRPELWALYNTHVNPGETIRVFPLSNWTELDIWQYIEREAIPIINLYFAEMRPVVERNGTLIMVDDERLPLAPGEQPQMRLVRFRTLGCYPLSGAIESGADTVSAIIAETFRSKSSERQGRLIDTDQPGSMEKKKQEGYF